MVYLPLLYLVDRDGRWEVTKDIVGRKLGLYEREWIPIKVNHLRQEQFNLLHKGS